MGDTTSGLARSITRSSSKQSYYTARLLVDKDLVNDFYLAYAYFRWVDDIIDVPSKSLYEPISFIRRQRELIDRIYRNELLNDLALEERMVAELISHDREESSGLESFIPNMLAVIEFDAFRRGRFINQQELSWYSERVGKSVTDGLLYFIGNGYAHPDTEDRYKAAFAAHITHLLRDMVADTAEGFINIPLEYLEEQAISPDNRDSISFRIWVKGQVEQARQYFREGKRYLDELEVLRTKIAGYWYCARFECVLNTIEHDGYLLRDTYSQQRKFTTLFKFTWLTLSISFRHLVRRSLRRLKLEYRQTSSKAATFMRKRLRRLTRVHVDTVFPND